MSVSPTISFNEVSMLTGPLAPITVILSRSRAPQLEDVSAARDESRRFGRVSAP